MALEEQRASLTRELNTLKHTHSMVSILRLPPMTFSTEHVFRPSAFLCLSLYPVSFDLSGSAGEKKGVGEGRVPTKVFHNGFLCLELLIILFHLYCMTSYNNRKQTFLLFQPLWISKNFPRYDISDVIRPILLAVTFYIVCILSVACFAAEIAFAPKVPSSLKKMLPSR